jgi:hypothetical protein
MDRLEYLQDVDLPADLVTGVPPHRVARLRRQGERYYADGMRDLPEERRLAILAVCALEWRASLADAVVEPMTASSAVSIEHPSAFAAPGSPTKRAVRDTLKSFAEIGGALLGAQDDGTALDGMRTPGIKGATDRPVAPD